MHKMTITITEVINFKSLASIPIDKVTAITPLYNIEPIITIVVPANLLLFPNKVSPIIIEASPITIIPVPIPTSAKPWYCASTAPEKATKAFAIISPYILYFSSFNPKDTIKFSLSPKAFKAKPNFVFNK